MKNSFLKEKGIWKKGRKEKVIEKEETLKKSILFLFVLMYFTLKPWSKRIFEKENKLG